jgi:flagellar assembly factor FliW
LKIDTIRFGAIEIEEDKIITMPEGMLGFPGRLRYIILHHREGSPFHWFQSVDDSSLAFVIMDPELFQPNYREAIRKEDLLSIQVDNLQEAAVFVVVNIARDCKMITANLEGPIVVNPEKMSGKQVVLADSSYSTRHVIFSKTEACCT